MKTVITYGTFDLFHVGHVKLLERLRDIGERVIVGVSTDEFNAQKGKRAFLPYSDRAAIVAACRHVDLVVPEKAWEQKRSDIVGLGADVFAMGDDWAGKFDDLKDVCDVVYLPRTHGVSSTSLKRLARALDRDTLARLSDAQAIIAGLLNEFSGE